MFKKFTRLSTRPTGGEHSTGLGLFIVRKLAEAMRSQVWCETEEGRGACFIAEFPAPLAATASPPEPPPISALNLAGLRVLLVEDNPVNQKVALLMLKKIGVAADVAGNGQEAFEAVRDKAYDVVFMDIQMPVMDGLEASRKITRELPAERQPWIIALTGGGSSPEEIQRCVDAGMQSYLAKPFTADDLQAALRHRMGMVGGLLS